MSTVDYAALAARVLKRKTITLRDSGLSRDRGIAIVAQAMQESMRARRRLRLWIGSTLTTAAAAAALLTTTHYFRLSHRAIALPAARACVNSPEGCGSASPGSLSNIDVGHMDGRDIMPGTVMQADRGRPARVEFDSGTHMSLDGNTMLAYDEGAANHRFSLARGSVHLEVAKLKKDQRFLLNTVDAEVEVRGTVFDVAVLDAANGCEQRTRVAVREGMVEVRSAAELRTLHGGDVWLGDCTPAAKSEDSSSKVASASARPVKSESGTNQHAPTSSLAIEAPTEAHPSLPAGSPNLPKLAAADASPTSDLVKQNDLYARASAERNQGHPQEALALYNQLIVRYPTSALVESARVQRIRLLKQTDKIQAAREATQYLVQFPKGFARSEAEALVNTP